MTWPGGDETQATSGEPYSGYQNRPVILPNGLEDGGAREEAERREKDGEHHEEDRHAGGRWPGGFGADLVGRSHRVVVPWTGRFRGLRRKRLASSVESRSSSFINEKTRGGTAVVH